MKAGSCRPGELPSLHLSRITGSLHELSIRLARERAATTGPGRSRRPTEELAEVRVVALREGSTVLDFAVGPPDMLPIEIEDMAWHDQDLARILSGLAKDQRPDGVSDHVADPVADLAQALRVAAVDVVLTVGSEPPMRFRASTIHRETWVTPRRAVGEDVIAVVGLLEKIDIHSHDLRIRDDVGNTLALTEVTKDIEAGGLIGRRVTATGFAVRSREGRLHGVQDPTIVPFTRSIPAAGLRHRPAPVHKPKKLLTRTYVRTTIEA